MTPQNRVQFILHVTKAVLITLSRPLQERPSLLSHHKRTRHEEENAARRPRARRSDQRFLRLCLTDDCCSSSTGRRDPADSLKGFPDVAVEQLRAPRGLLPIKMAVASDS